MWYPNDGAAEQVPPWAQMPSPYQQAPMYMQAPLLYPASPFDAPPVPFAPIGAPSPYSAAASLPLSPRYAPPPPPPPGPPRSPPLTKIHTTHHCNSHYLHIHTHTHSPQQTDAHKTSREPRPQVPSTQVASSQSHSHHHLGPVYSKCTGRKKALCIGINYTGQHRELHGCVNDAKNVREFLIKHYGYNHKDIFVLVDDSTHPHRQPTRANIINAMHWLVKDAKAHDSLVFHYSGHGGQTKDLDGDEVDGLDEVIFPVDYKWKGHIVDDELHKIMVKQLPKGCRLTALFDSCHSGSALDLPYLYHSDGRVKGHSEVTPSHVKEKSTKADVISFSGCTDSQTSADTYQGGAAVGAMSYAFMKSLNDKPNQTYQQLLLSVRSILKKNYSQKPQLSAAHRIDTTRRFIM
ncbi:uncharacterized protein LAESUDRAFT_725805 [Laetiporus sulphureus 93-53]|uniref:Peptidase C14 caspase domain-containing protein n=1 Tax=Laetiporus sulphureus 93-53 TaxID=1314785 RepID=A0A165EC93_9APHY|nr:uncharacterized protein LAESUDRAFT_725805 [Laetiporus sulphureus 93-53]KZT06714.1 hypothetical protein LAESUDRAFT_725805 [Laetiporus sulphureus 93-53]